MSMELMVKAMKVKVGNPLRKLVLIKMADNANDMGECWPSYQHIADQCEIDRSTVRKHIKHLESQRLLSIESREGPKGNSSNLYRLSLSNPVGQNSLPVGPESIGGCFGPTPPVGPESTRTSHYFESVKNTVADAPVHTKAKAPKFDPLSAKPENVDAQVWADWCRHRKEIRKPLTATTCAQQAKKLAGHQAPNQVLKTSIANGWSGIFPDKVLNSTAKAPSSRHNGFSNKDYTAGLKQREDGTYAL